MLNKIIHIAYKLKKIKNNFVIYRIKKDKKLNNINREFLGIKAYAGIQKLLEAYNFDSVLDIGSGEGKHSEIFSKYGKKVTAIDYGRSKYFKNNISGVDTIVGNYNTFNFEKQFDCIWASHILEHQIDPHSFLLKIYKDLKEDGVLAITVPPMKPTIVGGHVNLYNTGLLLYRLILAGFDCKNAKVFEYDYNITVLVKKTSINVLEKLNYDSGDIRSLKEYFPDLIQDMIMDGDNFNGNIEEINW